MIKTLKILLLISLFAPTVLMASKPSEEVVQRVQAAMEVLKTNPESEPELALIHQEIQRIMQEDGMEGIAWLAYKNPVMMEAFIRPESMGLENIAVSLLKQATTKEEMKDMLVVLVSAQIGSQIDPFADVNLALLKRGCGESSVAIDDSAMDQIISEALVLGAERGGSEVHAASFGGSLRELLIALKRKLIELGYLNYIHPWEEIVSPVTSHHYDQK